MQTRWIVVGLLAVAILAWAQGPPLPIYRTDGYGKVTFSQQALDAIARQCIVKSADDGQLGLSCHGPVQVGNGFVDEKAFQ